MNSPTTLFRTLDVFFCVQTAVGADVEMRRMTFDVFHPTLDSLAV